MQVLFLLFAFCSGLVFRTHVLKMGDGCATRCLVLAETEKQQTHARPKPLISVFARLNVTHGTIVDSKLGLRPSVCGSFVTIDFDHVQKDVEFRGDFRPTGMTGAWYHMLNEQSRLGSEFPVLQLALSSPNTEVRGSFTATTSADEAGIVAHNFCCNCAREEL